MKKEKRGAGQREAEVRFRPLAAVQAGMQPALSFLLEKICANRAVTV
jgi:hypothetical protein